MVYDFRSFLVGIAAHVLEQCQEVLQVIGSHVDVGRDVDCTGSVFALALPDVETATDAFMVGRALDLLEVLVDSHWCGKESEKVFGFRRVPECCRSG
jgi:hypothetical protein